MDTTQRVATWLDLAATREWRTEPACLRVHAVGGRKDRCYAVTLDGRWLCASDGSLTVFYGREAAERFLLAARIGDFESGEAAVPGVLCDGAHVGLCLGRDGCLKGCRQAGRGPELNG